MRDFITKIMKFSFLKARRGSCINHKDPPQGENKQFQLHKLSSSSSSFVDLIIGEAVGPPLSNHPFAGSRCIADALRVKQSR